METMTVKKVKYIRSDRRVNLQCWLCLAYFYPAELYRSNTLEGNKRLQCVKCGEKISLWDIAL